MRLNVEKLKDNIRNLNNIPITLQYDILHTIRVLQQENEQLKADLRGKDNEINDLKALIEYLTGREAYEVE